MDRRTVLKALLGGVPLMMLGNRNTPEVTHYPPNKWTIKWQGGDAYLVDYYTLYDKAGRPHARVPVWGADWTL